MRRCTQATSADSLRPKTSALPTGIDNPPLDSCASLRRSATMGSGAMPAQVPPSSTMAESR